MKKDNQTIRVAFYLRVSTDEQGRDGYGLDMQLNGLQEMMEYRNKHHDWVHQTEWEYIDNGYTGANLERPEYKRMMKDAQAKKFDIIAVWKIDRLSRNLSHLLSSFESLQKNDVNFFSLKENIDFSGPIGKLTFQIFWALAEFERETIAMRTKEWKRASARSGNYVINSAPFWYEKIQREWRSGKTLKIIEWEARWVREIFKLFNAWASLESIAKTLNEHKVMKWAGGMNENRITKWYWTTVKDILVNTTYCGNALYNTKIDKWEIQKIPIPVPSIVSSLDFSIAESRLEDVSKNLQRWWWQNEYLLSRKIVDMETGIHFFGVKRTKGGHSYRREAIKERWLKNREIAWSTIDDYVWGFIEKAIHRPKDLFDAYKKQNIENTNYEALIDQRRKADTELQKIDDIEMTIETEYLWWDRTRENRDKLMEKYETQKTTLSKKIIELDKKLDAIIKAESTKQALEAFGENLTTKIENLDMDQKKALVNILVEKIEVTYTQSRDWKDSAPNLKVIMRFKGKLMEENQDNLEPKKLSANSKTDSEELDNEWYGAIDRTRTCDLLLRREAF